MELITLENTCSMDELSEPIIALLDNKLEFLKWIRNHVDDNNDDDNYDPDNDELNKLQVIIYNCENRNMEPKLHTLGFRKKHSYIGNNPGPFGGHARINVWFLTITNKLRKKINKSVK